jgi:transcriptional regulator with XRE-family HTH domain
MSRNVPRIGLRKPARLFIHEWMEKRRLNQTDIARRLEVGSSGTISKKLKDPAKMSTEWIAAFAFALDVEVGDLYRHPDRPTQEELLAGLDEPVRAVIVQMLKSAKRA